MQKNSSTQGLRTRAAGRVAGLCVAAAVALAAGGCALVKMGYRNGDTVGLFWIDRYLDLSSDQKEFIKPRLHQLLVWHRTTQLPDYVSFGQELQRRASQPITTEEVDAISLQGRRRAMTTIDHALPDMADLALRLTPDNIKALQQKFADDTDKWRRENMTGDADRQRKVRYEKTLERVEEWYGRFSAQQRDRIRQSSDARPLDNEVVVGERVRRQQELVALLTKVEREQPSREAVVAMLRTYAERFEVAPEPERRASLESLRRATEEMDAAIHNLSTPGQRARAVASLQEWIDVFRNLAADPG